MDPSVVFTPDVTSGDAPLHVEFSVSCSPGDFTIAGYEVDYGDGATPSTESGEGDPDGFGFSHDFTPGGVYFPTITVYTDDATPVYFTFDATSSVTVTNVEPEATVTADFYRGRRGTTVTFTMVTTEGTLPILEWNLDFGSGEGSDGDTGVPDGATPFFASHDYNNLGTFTPVLTLTTEAGATPTSYTSDSLDVVIFALNPAATVDVHPHSGANPLEVHFEVVATSPDIAIDGYVLDYGDGDDTSGVDPNTTMDHTYNIGRFTPTLTLTLEDASAWVFGLTTVIVDRRLFDGSASLTADVAVGVTPFTVEFTVTADRGSDSASGDVFFLDPGDDSDPIPLSGDPSAEVVSYEYAEPGKYRATLTMEGDYFSGVVAR